MSKKKTTESNVAVAEKPKRVAKRRVDAPVQKAEDVLVAKHRLIGDVSKNIESIFENGVLVDLNIGFWSAQKRNTAGDLGIDVATLPNFVVGLGMKRLIPKSLSDQWRRAVGQARYIVRRNSYVFPVGQSAFVPVAGLPKIETELGKCQATFEKAKNALLDDYDGIREQFLSENEEHRLALSRLYPPRDAVAGKFYFTWSVFNVTLPRKGQLSAFNKKKHDADEAALAKYRVDLEARFGEFIGDAVATLRQKTAEICADVAAKIKADEIVTERSLTKLRRHVDNFKMMDIAGDRSISAMLDTLKKETLRDRDAETFTTNEDLRNSLVNSLNQIHAAAIEITDVAITGGYARRVRV